MEDMWNTFWKSGSVEDYLHLKGIVPASEKERKAKRGSVSDRDRNGALGSAFRGL